MSTITKELAKLFRKITNSEIDAEGNAHVVLSPADSLLINNARIALASLEAEPVAWAHRLINKRNGVVHPWVYGSAEACPSEGDIFNIEVMPLYTVHPAPVSVPDAMEMDDDFDSAFEHGKAVGWNACRAAMLNHSDDDRDMVELVRTAYKLPSTRFQQVADLYGVTSPTGSETSFTFDAFEASSFAKSGWAVQEYVELERYQEAVAGNSPAIPDGWQLVPVEPTKEMIDAGWLHFIGTKNPSYKGTYKVMLAAAPQQE
ncbi:DUF551 domain-containing protein [Pseudocitrobacter sp. 73]|uniref:DUF551 domain-containing protein n=1 Tax=Pseudocitrobacter sp. 73 TaxID=2605731 RepID=UPI0021072E9F|nr:DUF551 domain-containing protein [Pseudocitrobacter sp. 73]